MRDDSLRGVRVESFQIHQRLATGGSCDVHLAKHLKKDLWVAVKAIRGDRIDDKRLNKQLEREYAILSEFKMRSIPRVLKLVEVEGRKAMLMQLGPDNNLARIIGIKGCREWREVWMQILETVTHLHTNDIIHNDLKPENILVYPDGKILLIDFGLARQLATNVVTRMFVRQKRQTHGTAAYLAPEVQSGKAPSPQSDVYALGLILWRMVTGKLISDSRPDFSTVKGLTRLEVEIMNRAVSNKPANRPASAWDLHRIFRQSEHNIKQAAAQHTDRIRREDETDRIRREVATDRIKRERSALTNRIHRDEIASTEPS